MENGLMRIMAAQARKAILHEMHGEMPLLAALLADYDELRRENDELRRENDELQRDNEELRRQVAAQHGGDWDGEEWRDIAGYEGLYRVSNRGRVMSFHRGKCRILKAVLQHSGYFAFNLRQNGIQKTFFAHRLVALAFILNPDDKEFVNHKDGNRLNNRVENLEWCSPSENTAHAYRIGLASPVRFLSVDQVRYVRENPDGFTDKKLAEMFGVSVSTINHCKTGRSYKDVK